MQKFNDALNDFFKELREIILMELSESNPTYVEIKTEKVNYYERIKRMIPEKDILDMFSAYDEAQDALESFELNYCFLHGMRDAKKLAVISPTSEEITQELSQYEKYKQLQTQTLQLNKELRNALTDESCVLLTAYTFKREKIAEVEKHYCYIGGINDKARLDKFFSFADGNEWTKLINLFC